MIGVSLLAMLRGIEPAAAAEATATENPAAVTWAGFYFGANLGTGIPPHVTERLQAVSGFGSPAFDLYPQGAERSGLTFGAQVGYNWVHENLVYGLETELSFLDGQRGPSGTFPTPPAYWPMGISSYALTTETSGTYFGSFRGRLGLAFDRLLLYATGGLATGGWRGGSALTLNGRGFGNPFVSGVSQSSRMKFILGGGIEQALDANWSARLEYLFLNQSLNTQLFDNGDGFIYASRAQVESHILRFGLNYRLPVDDGATGSGADAASSAKSAAPEPYSVHGQITELGQGYPKFRALYSGPNSLAPPSGQAHATTSATGFFGLRLWAGGEAYINPEVDEGFGLSDTHGVAGYPSAEAYKLGRAAPYQRFQRYFLRQIIGLGGESEEIDSGANALAGKVDSNRLTFTVGKYSIVDIFDDNKYAHDGRSGFMNWSILDMGAFDYAADAWGFTHGATVEWRQDWWTARAGVFQMPQIPNGNAIEPVLFRQFSPVVEFEARHTFFFGQPGKVKFLGFGDSADMGKYDEAVDLALPAGTTPDVTLIRRRRFKAGGGVNIEQPLTDDVGVFLRASLANGRYESLAFAEIERSLSAGVVFGGSQWGRAKDAIGLAGVINGVSGSHARYLAASGLGPFLGDGALSYEDERILEAYYKFNLVEAVHLTADYQFLDNPGYNRVRGPASLFALRLHGDF